MHIRALSAMGAAVTVALGAATVVAVAQNGDGTKSTPRGGTPGSALRSGTASSAAGGGTASSATSWAEIMNSLPAGAARSAVRKPAVPDDFNGDGYRDIASGGPNGTGGDLVTVIYGGRRGADPARRQVMIARPVGPDTDLGWQIQSADFDRDGFADLLIYRGETTTTIVYGGPRGLTSRTAALPEATGEPAVGDFDGNGVPDVASTKAAPEATSSHDAKNVVVYANPRAKPGKAIVSNAAHKGDYEVRRSLLTGDFNGDRRTDLLLVASNWTDGQIDGSWIELRPGTARGLGPATLLPQEQTDSIESSPAAAGDINGDGRADLVTMVDSESRRSGTQAFAVRLATAQGFGKARVFDAASLGLPGSRFGVAELRAGDVNADGRADVIVGSETVSVLFGTRTGLTTKRRQSFHQGTKGVPGTAEARDRFGEGLSLTDTDRDGKIELVVGAPGEDNNEGRLYVFAGTPQGLTTRCIKHFGPAALGIGGKKSELGGELLD